MKSSRQILGLPVMSIEEGLQIGEANHLVLNQRGAVDFLLIKDRMWYLGLKTVPFNTVQGFGENALTVAASSTLIPVQDNSQAVELLEKDFHLNGLKVISNKGKILGAISEYYFDETTGDITGCQIIPNDSESPAGIIPRKYILSFGLDYLVVEDGVESKLVSELEVTVEAAPPAGYKRVETEDTTEAPKTKSASADKQDDDKQPVKALKHFEDQQRQYLLGKKVTMRILADDGDIIAEEGQSITVEMIEKAVAANKYVQLTLNVRE
ncbi:PRC-barrel domain protein [Pelotomaculum sp. FP]|uniref:PRC-barrel domain-containing protein n=1 Tax=Pelotomaculum sp. FP TaxID=261474 RepID=UPI0010654E89|nr:PRC-barrel domain-containing protein [Pelotomaculum sp. FP]TEB13286.1 PRC-barrel domain protein [Pelotomaculum sp. FP]